MKKGLIVLLVMVLAVGSVFAGISGAAELRAGYNTADKSYGFTFKDSNLSIDFDYATSSSETIGEGPVAATLKGSVTLKAADLATGVTAASKGAVSSYVDNMSAGFGIFAGIDELSVAGEGWKVAYNGGYQTFADYASSPVDTYYGAVKDAFDNATWNTKKAVSLGAGWADKFVPGVLAEVAGYKVGVAIKGVAEDSKNTHFSFKAETPVYAVADGVTFQGAVAASKTKYVAAEAVTTQKTSYYTTSACAAGDEVYEKVAAISEVKDPLTFGISAKAGYANDLIGVNVAGDVAIVDSKANFDVSLNAKYDFVTVDAYYLSAATIDEYAILDDYSVKKLKGHWSDEKLLSAKAVVVLDQFVGMPLSVTVSGSDLLDNEKGQKLAGSASVTYDAITATVSGSYKISNTETTVGGSVAYEADLYTASAGLNYWAKGALKSLVPAVSVTSDKLVSGATVGVKWDANTDYDYEANGKLAGLTATNLLSGTDFGNIYAFINVAF